MKKRIISLILSVVLILGCLFSMSSCLSLFGFYTSDSSQGNGQDGNNSGGGGVINENADIPKTEYYPSIGGDDITPEFISESSRAILSVVSVYSTFEISYGYPSYSTESSTARGSGVIYKLDRENGNAYVITNYHVVYSTGTTSSDGISKDIRLFLYGQEADQYAIPATYVGGSMAQDLAVLKVEGSEVLKRSQALPAAVADSDKVSVLDTVIAIGNPEGLGISATNGIISVESETLAMIGADGRTTIQPRVMRVSAAINDGNSGGGLFNAKGELIGIVNAKRNGNYVDNIAYAIPSNVATRLADNIILYCDGSTNTAAKKAMIGIVMQANVMGVTIDAETGKVVRAEIVEIKEISSICTIPEKFAIGDRINSITIDGLTIPVTRVHHVVDSMLLARVGSVVTVNLTRGAETFDVTVTITENMFSNV